MSNLPASAFIGLRGLVAWEYNKPRVLWEPVTLYGWHSYLFIVIYYWVCKYPSAKPWKPFVRLWVWDFWEDHWQCRVQQLTAITKPSSLSEMCIWESVSFLNVWVYFSQTDYTYTLKCQRLPVLLAQRSISQPVWMQKLLPNLPWMCYFLKIICSLQIVIHVTFITHSCSEHEVQKLLSFGENVLILSSIGWSFSFSALKSPASNKFHCLLLQPCACLCIVLLARPFALGS